LLQKWELVAQQIQALAAKITKKGDKHYRAAHALFHLARRAQKLPRPRPRLRQRQLSVPRLKCLKDVEHHSHLQAAELGLDREADLVTGPHNVLGIELNEYAAELARVTVWIGEIQWCANAYEGRVPGGADLVTYWFEKARAQIEAGQSARRRGWWPPIRYAAVPTARCWIALSTPANLRGVERRGWINEGAAVRVSLGVLWRGVTQQRSSTER
jgi:hypothetical protein